MPVRLSYQIKNCEILFPAFSTSPLDSLRMACRHVYLIVNWGGAWHELHPLQVDDGCVTMMIL